MAITTKANEVIKSAFPALRAKHDMMNITPVFTAEYATTSIPFNRLPFRLTEQFTVLLCILVHVVNALSMLQPLLSL